MFAQVIDAVFGCRHARYSFPMTIRPGSGHVKTVGRIGTYVVCLDCGREFSYDWQEMKMASSRPREVARSLVTKEAA